MYTLRFGDRAIWERLKLIRHFLAASATFTRCRSYFRKSMARRSSNSPLPMAQSALSHDSELASNRETIWSYIAIEIDETRQMTVFRGVQIQDHGKRLLVLAVDGAFLMQLHRTIIRCADVNSFTATVRY